MISIDQFDYDLPKHLIAHNPPAQRSSSKLLTFDRQSLSIVHQNFQNLPALLNEGDILVRNETKVIPARMFGKTTSGKSIEVLLIRPVENTTTWECLVKPGIKQGDTLRFSDTVWAENQSDKHSYLKRLAFSVSELELEEELVHIGHTPLPPYIHSTLSESQLRMAYQTTYAKNSGSVAAPTAGLHFTPDLDESLRNRGVEILSITLHVGIGTFAPLKAESFITKQLHQERYELDAEVFDKIQRAKSQQRKIIAVGTTTTRVLESLDFNSSNKNTSTSGETALFIFPPYRFTVVDGLITNFHLPKSSLLALISAFTTTPNSSESFASFDKSAIGQAYQEAIQKEYRFFSFGDAMFIT